jgi:hypothetical protein
MPGQKSSLEGRQFTPQYLEVLKLAWAADGQNIALQHPGDISELYSLSDQYFGKLVDILADMSANMDCS